MINTNITTMQIHCFMYVRKKWFNLEYITLDMYVCRPSSEEQIALWKTKIMEMASGFRLMVLKDRHDF